jgi:hypothetical protein
MHTRLTSSITAVIVAHTALGAFDPAAFRFTKAVQPAAGAPAIAALTIDTDIYAAAQADFTDVRLVDDGGTEIPCRSAARSCANASSSWPSR